MPLVRLASFLALLLFFMGYYLSFTLFDFLPVVSGGGTAMTIYLLNFAGTALGAILYLRFSCGALFNKPFFAVVFASGDSPFYPSAMPRFV